MDSWRYSSAMNELALEYPPLSISHCNAARLNLRFADDAGTTRLVERAHYGPLRMQKPLYPEGPQVCHAIVVHPPGGIVGGDELSIAANVNASAQAFITTPGAAKWYRANGKISRQRISLEVADHAALEWLPQETIFFNDAKVELQHTVELGVGATYIGADVLCFGRTASGEYFNTGKITQSYAIRRAGKLIWFEQGAIAGDGPLMGSPLAMAGKTVCATLIAAGKTASPSLIDAMREQAAAINDGNASFGISQLKSILVARYLGDSSETAKRLMTEIWKMLRPMMLNREAAIPRIWNT
jgi:urease accessory protein